MEQRNLAERLELGLYYDCKKFANAGVQTALPAS